MDQRHYIVRHVANDSHTGWCVELAGEVVCRTRHRRDAVAAASAAARDAAGREHLPSRVSLVTDAGDCIPLAAFGSKLDHQQTLMKKLARRWAA